MTKAAVIKAIAIILYVGLHLLLLGIITYFIAGFILLTR